MKITKVKIVHNKIIIGTNRTSLNVAAVKCIVHLLGKNNLLAGRSLFIEYIWQDVPGCLGFLIAYNTLCIYGLGLPGKCHAN